MQWLILFARSVILLNIAQNVCIILFNYIKMDLIANAKNACYQKFHKDKNVRIAVIMLFKLLILFVWHAQWLRIVRYVKFNYIK